MYNLRREKSKHCNLIAECVKLHNSDWIFTKIGIKTAVKCENPHWNFMQ